MLRDYQTKLINDTYRAFDHGAQGVCVQASTGLGKSVILRNMVKRHQGYSCTVAHRQELISQLSMHLASEGLKHRIIAPSKVAITIAKEHIEEYGRSFIDDTSIRFVASAQTLVARSDRLGDWAQQVSFLAVDEGHHYVKSNAFGKAIDLFPNAKRALFTATPSRTDGKGLSSSQEGYADALVIGPPMRWAIDNGFLSDYEIILPKGDFDRSRLTIGSTGDFTQSSLKQEAERSHIVGDVVQTWLQVAPTLQTIIFATDIETSNKIAAGFQAWGINAQSVSSKTGEYERFKAIKLFRNRQLQVLVNVGLFDEGFDVPGVECVVMARPTQSLGLYLQTCGRALRPSPGKEYALIIDHVSNVAEHNIPDMPRAWTLQGRERKARLRDDEIPLTICDGCFREYERKYRKCPYCGHERVPTDRSGPEQVDGDLELLDRETLAKMRAAIQLESPVALAQRVTKVAGAIAGKGAMNRQMERLQVQQELSDAIALWAGHGRASGKPDSQLYREFYFANGADVLTALAGTSAQMKEIIERLGVG